MNQAKASLNF